MIVSNTYDLSVKFLGLIKNTLSDPDIKEQFNTRFVKDTEDEIIVDSISGRFCIIARGSGQKLRGLIWNQKRPNLIIGDDLEDDEMIRNPDRRREFSRWFMNALIPCGSKSCKYRILGTVLHFDSLLEKLLNDVVWTSKRYRAHKSYDDFSNILWPERWSEKLLRDTRQMYISQGNADGYSAEFLNEPVAEGEAFFREEDMLPMLDKDLKNHSDGNMTYYASCDAAVSTKQRADFTVFVIAGVDEDNFINVVDVRRLKIDSEQIVNEMLEIHKRYKPALFVMEQGAIESSILPFLNKKQRETGIYLNYYPISHGGKDKVSRAQPFKAMMKAGSVKFNKDASWWLTLHDEMRKFTPSGSKSGHDDQIDALSYIGAIADEFSTPSAKEDENEDNFLDNFRVQSFSRRNSRTGY